MRSKDLSREDFLGVVSKYYSEKEEKDAHLQIELSITYGLISMMPNLKLYYEDKNHARAYISDDDICEALCNYAEDNNASLDSYQYLGGVTRMGMFVDEDTPFFNGVRLYAQDKEKTDSPVVRARCIENE